MLRGPCRRRTWSSVRRGISVETFWTLLDEHVVWDLRAYPVLDLDGVYVGRDAVIKASLTTGDLA